METRICPYCEKEIHALSISCPYCGAQLTPIISTQPDETEQPLDTDAEAVEPETEETGETGETMELEIEESESEEPLYEEQLYERTCSNCGIPLLPDEAVCPECGTPVAQQKSRRFKLPFTLNRKNVILISVITAVVLIGIIITVVLLRGSPSRTLKRAQALSDNGNYIAALEQLEGISGDRADALINEIYEKMETEITDLISNGKLPDARKRLDTYTMLPSVTRLTALLQSKCDHVFESKILKESSCTENGSKQDTCTICGKIENNIIQPSGHKYVEKIDKEATCTEPGKKTETCSVCGNTRTEEIPKTDHDFQEATCTEPQICKKCGMRQGEALGHIDAKATCTEAGVCSRCKKTVEEPLGHDYKNGVCTRCGDKQADYAPSYSPGSTFELSDRYWNFKYSIGKNYSFETVEEENSSHKGELAVVVPVTITNIGDTPADLSGVRIGLYHPSGQKSYYTVWFVYDDEDQKNASIQPKDSISGAFYFTFTGNGNYNIEIESPYSAEKAKINLTVTK